MNLNDKESAVLQYLNDNCTKPTRSGGITVDRDWDNSRDENVVSLAKAMHESGITSWREFQDICDALEAYGVAGADADGRKVYIIPFGQQLIRQKTVDNRPATGTTDVILLVHGIRDFAEWNRMVERELETENTRVIGIKFGYFNVFRFLAPRWPIDFSRAPQKEVLRNLKQARDEFPDATLSVVAHSFGSHLITQILEEEADIRLKRVLSCGSVVARQFRWDKIKLRIGDGGQTRDFIVNDCGTKDMWPAFARAVGWKYGDAGTNGFGSILVTDRCHKGGHGLFMDKSFVQRYWTPFFHHGKIVDGDGEFREDIPLWLSVLPGAARAIQAVIALCIAAVVIYFWPGKVTVPSSASVQARAYNSESTPLLFEARLPEILIEGPLHAIRIDSLPSEGQLLLDGAPVRLHDEIPLRAAREGRWVFSKRFEQLDRKEHHFSFAFSVFDGANYSDSYSCRISAKASPPLPAAPAP